MKKSLITALLACGVLGLTGCEMGQDKEAMAPKEDVKVEKTMMTDEMKEKVEKAKEAAMEKKKDMTEDMKKKLEELKMDHDH